MRTLGVYNPMVNLLISATEDLPQVELDRYCVIVSSSRPRIIADDHLAGMYRNSGLNCVMTCHRGKDPHGESDRAVELGGRGVIPSWRVPPRPDSGKGNCNKLSMNNVSTSLITLAASSSPCLNCA